VRVRTIIKKISIRSIDAKRFIKGNGALKNIKITNSSGITSLQVTDDLLIVGFVYSVDYFPNFASVKIEGELVYGDIDTSSIEPESKKIPTALSQEIHTAILRFCMPELVIIAKQLELIPPIPMPSVGAKQEQQTPTMDNKLDYR